MTQDEDEETPPLGLSREDWHAMLADVRKREISNKKRSETMKAKAAARRAERLSRPPTNVAEAWRRHADSCPHLPMSPEARTWFRENRTFEFDGTRWTREIRRQLSNSGKTKKLRSITYYAADGRTEVEFDDGPNRRNDPSRETTAYRIERDIYAT